MGMSRFEVFFQKMNFHQFISMSLDQYKAHGDEFVSRYAKLIDMIMALVDSALSLSDLNLHCPFESTKSKLDIVPVTATLFKKCLDTSVQESTVTRDVSTGKEDTIKYNNEVHNCGFVWNTNTMGFVSDVWADGCMIMESEFPDHVTRTHSTKQVKSTKLKLDILPVTATSSTRVSTRDAEEFDDNDVPMPHTLHSGASDHAPLIRCVFDQPSDEDAQLLDVCPHRIGECDRNESWGSFLNVKFPSEPL